MRAWLLFATCAALVVGCVYDFDKYDPTGGDAANVSTDAGVDSAAPIDTGPFDTGPIDTGCMPPDPTSPCYATVKTCAATCADTRKSCEAACSNPGCKKNCATNETTCRSGCVSDCTSCTATAGCSAPSQCRAALP